MAAADFQGILELPDEVRDVREGVGLVEEVAGRPPNTIRGQHAKLARKRRDVGPPGDGTVMKRETVDKDDGWTGPRLDVAGLAVAQVHVLVLNCRGGHRIPPRLKPFRPPGEPHRLRRSPGPFPPDVRAERPAGSLRTP